MAFAPVNIGNVLAQAEQIKALRAQNDPNSPQNRLRDMQLLKAESDLRQAGQPDPLKAVEYETAQERLRQLKNPPAAKYKAGDIQKRQTDQALILRRMAESEQEYARGWTQLQVMGAIPKDQTFESVPWEERSKRALAQSEQLMQGLSTVSDATRRPLVEQHLHPGSKAEEIEGAKMDVRWAEGALERATASDDILQNLDQLSAMDLQTGALEPWKARFASVAHGFGLTRFADQISKIETVEGFRSISNRMVNAMLNLAKGPQTEGDAQRARETQAQLGNTQLGNKFIIALARSSAMAAKELAAFIDDRRAEGMRIGQARREWRKYANFPRISPTRKDADGLPVFFFDFKNYARKTNPSYSDADIVEAWKEYNAQQTQ